MQTVESRKYS